MHLVFPKSRHRLELNYYPPGNRFYEPLKAGTEFDHFGFYATEVEPWALRAKRAGGQIVADFVEDSQRLIYVRDPNGIWLEFFGSARPKRSKRRARTHATIA